MLDDVTKRRLFDVEVQRLRNRFDRMVCPFVEWMEFNTNELRLCWFGREKPNIEMGLRRIQQMVDLVKKLNDEIKKMETSALDVKIL